MENTALLIKKVRQGDRAAFDELYKIYYLSLLSYATLFLSKEEAEDVVQDVFLNVWLNKERLDPSLSFRSYLLRSVYNSSLNQIKKKNYSSEYSSIYRKEIEEMGYLYFNPDANDIICQLYNKDLHKQLEHAINSLPEKCRKVFSLSYIYDVPSKEISRQLGISVSTVDNHIYTALKLLRKKLDNNKIVLLIIFLGFL